MDRSDHSLPFRVEEDEKRGRHLIATRDIQPLELVLRDTPVVIGPATKTPPVCLECLKAIPNGTAAFRCRQCRFPLCGKDCSVGPAHSEDECSALSNCRNVEAMTEANGEDRIVYAAVFVYRFWLLAQRNPADHARATFLMTGDTDDLRGNGIANEVTDIIQNDFGVGIGLDDVCRYMGIKRTNANRRQTREQYGTVLYPVYPLINSYCYSNTRCDVADDLTMEVRAQVKIREGEEITTRYVSAMNCQPRRHDQLWRNWRFVCPCRRCLDPTEFSTYFSAVRCVSCPNGFLLPHSPTVLASPWACGNCEQRVGHRDICDRLELLEEKMKAVSGGDESQVRRLIVDLEQHVHPNHFFIFCLKERLLFHREGALTEDTLESKLQLAEEMSRLLSVLDPGFTARMGKLAKVMAKDRLTLAKLKNKEEATELVKVAMKDLRRAAMCLKYGK